MKKRCIKKMYIVGSIALLMTACGSQENKSDLPIIDEEIQAEDLLDDYEETQQIQDDPDSNVFGNEEYCFEDFVSANLYHNLSNNEGDGYIWITDEYDTYAFSESGELCYQSPSGYISKCLGEEVITPENNMINKNGEIVTSKYENDSDTIITANNDRSGLSVWTKKVDETFESYIVTLKVKDIDGNTKAEFCSANEPFVSNKDVVDDVFKRCNSEDIYFAGEDIYYLIDSYPDENYKQYTYILSIDDNSVIKTYDRECKVYAYGDKIVAISDSQIETIDREGKIINSIDYFGRVCWCGNGTFILKDIRATGHIETFYWGDVEGNIIIDFLQEQYSVDHVVDLCEGGYFMINLYNDERTTYATVFDENGKMMFEPIKGTGLHNYVPELGCFLMIEDYLYYMVDINGNRVLIDNIAGGNQAKYYVQNKKFYYIDNEGILRYLSADDIKQLFAVQE